VVATVTRLWEARQFGLIHALASVATTPSANVYKKMWDGHQGHGGRKQNFHER